MRRSPTDALFLLLPVLLGACTLFPGRPWGEVEASLAVGFEPTGSRLSDEGRLLTSRDYEISLDRLALQVDALEVEVAEPSGAPVSFDPASPPEGYSLCHGGHCHADDGRLVEYDVVERDLGGGSGGFTLTLPAAEAGPVDVTRGEETVPLSPCPQGCLLERGELVGVSVWLSRVEGSGRVYDRRQGEDARLPEEGVPFELSLALSTPVRQAVSLPLDGSEPPALVIGAKLVAPPSLFDDVDFATRDEEHDASIEEKLRDEGELVLAISRKEHLGDPPSLLLFHGGSSPEGEAR